MDFIDNLLINILILLFCFSLILSYDNTLIVINGLLQYVAVLKMLLLFTKLLVYFIMVYLMRISSVVYRYD